MGERGNRHVSRKNLQTDIRQSPEKRVVTPFSLRTEKGLNPPEIPSETNTNEVRLEPRRYPWQFISCNVSSFARVMVHHIIGRRHVGTRSDGIMTLVRDSLTDPPLSSPSSPLRTPVYKYLHTCWDTTGLFVLPAPSCDFCTRNGTAFVTVNNNRKKDEEKDWKYQKCKLKSKNILTTLFFNWKRDSICIIWSGGQPIRISCRSGFSMTSFPME